MPDSSKPPVTRAELIANLDGDPTTDAHAAAEDALRDFDERAALRQDLKEMALEAHAWGALADPGERTDA